MSKSSLNFKTHNCAKPVIRFCIFAIIICLATGCSSAPKNVEVPMMQLEPEDLIISQKPLATKRPAEIRTSLNDNRPAWIHKPAFEQGDSIYFSGGFQNGGDYSMTLKIANSEALKSLLQTVGISIQAEYTAVSKGSNSIDSSIERYIEDGIATFTRNIHIQGIRQVESYYEEMHDPTNPMKPFYNAWVQLEISKADYLKAKVDILRQLRKDFHSAGEIEAKEKAQELLNDLKGQVSEFL